MFTAFLVSGIPGLLLGLGGFGNDRSFSGFFARSVHIGTDKVTVRVSLVSDRLRFCRLT